MNIPTQTPYSIKRGDRGYQVWALQRALDTMMGAGLVEDGVFGPATKAAVKRFQAREGLVVDEVFGPICQAHLAQWITEVVDDEKGQVPGGLLRSVVGGESGNFISAVNWSVPGGVDVGYCQRRLYESEYDDETIKQRAFDSLYQVRLLSDRLRDRKKAYYGKTGAKTHEVAWRLAVLYHNYPSAAEKIAEVGIGGLTVYWQNPQTWVKNIGAKFPDGAPVQTPLEWCQRYSLGAAAHNEPGVMVKYVTTWS